MHGFHTYHCSANVSLEGDRPDEGEGYDFCFEITMRCTAKTWPASADDPGAASEWDFSSANVGNRGISWIDLCLFLGEEIVGILIEQATRDAIERSGK